MAMPSRGGHLPSGVASVLGPGGPPHPPLLPVTPESSSATPATSPVVVVALRQVAGHRLL
eukprot:scaffold40568_cov54-Phaeocystis_antarctica.AAC.1